MSAEVSSQPDPDVPGLVGYYITGFSEQEVQHAINQLQFRADTIVMQSEFSRPRRTRGRWHAFGWTRVPRPS